MTFTRALLGRRTTALGAAACIAAGSLTLGR